MTTREDSWVERHWARWTAVDDQAIAQLWADLAQPAASPAHRPHFAFEQARRHWEAMLRRYSAGRPIAELRAYFDGQVRAWEESMRLGATVCTPERQASRGSWAQNLDLYVSCFWLTGLALALDIPDAQWQRLVALMVNEGEDELLDRVIATRLPGRRIGTTLCHPQTFARLPAAGRAEVPAERGALLRDFVQHWYRELDRKATRGRPAIYNRPYWYRFGYENFEGGAYFGRWCMEVVAAAHEACAAPRHDPKQTMTGGRMNHELDRRWARPVLLTLLLAAVAWLAGCASAPPERFAAPAPDAPAAEVQLRLMPASRNRSAALYVPGAVKCNPSALTSVLQRTVEDPPRLVAGSWENRFNEVVRLPAGAPLALRFRYLGPGEEYVADLVVVLEPGRRYVFDHEIPGRRVSLVGAGDGPPPLRLPARTFHDAVKCPG